MTIFKITLTSVFAFFSIQIIALIIFRVLVNNSYWALLPLELEAYTVVILTLPLAVTFVLYFSSGYDLMDKLRFLKFKPIRLSVALKWGFVTVFWWWLNYFISNVVSSSDESFMVDAKLYLEDVVSVIIIFFSVCIFAPLVEELFFRGWLFKKLILLNLEPTKVLIISALLFMCIHFQYNNFPTFLSLFCTGIFLGYIRLRTNNMSYSILAHSIFNFMSFIGLFL